jgi:hypothetical protein
MQITSWAFYNLWTPRAVVNFEAYYFTASYNILSMGIALLFIYFMMKNKAKYLIIIFIIGIFLSKGHNKPFGDLYLWIINYSPFGYMIRTPDTKFGLIVSATYILGYFYCNPRQKIVYLSLSCIFLLNNIFGMYSHGAISPIKGNPDTSYYLYDSEYKDVINIINRHNNHVVLTDHNNCVGKLSSGKFYTCNDLVLSGITKQVVGGDINPLPKLIKDYEIFPKILYFNRQIVSPNKYPDPLDYINKGYKVIYNSDHYILLIEVSDKSSCFKSHDFGCIKRGNEFVISAPRNYSDYYYGDLIVGKIGQFSILKSEPSYSTSDKKYLIFLFIVLFSYLMLIFLLIKIVKITKVEKSI